MSYPYFEAKKKIVQSGNSSIFRNWQEATNGKLTVEAFLAGLEWLCADPLDDQGRVTLALGLNGDGTLVKLSYARTFDSVTIRYAEDCGKNRAGALWGGSMFTMKLSPADMMFYGKSEIRMLAKIAISVKDKI